MALQRVFHKRADINLFDGTACGIKFSDLPDDHVTTEDDRNITCGRCQSAPSKKWKKGGKINFV